MFILDISIWQRMILFFVAHKQEDELTARVAASQSRITELETAARSTTLRADASDRAAREASAAAEALKKQLESVCDVRSSSLLPQLYTHSSKRKCITTEC